MANPEGTPKMCSYATFLGKNVTIFSVLGILFDIQFVYYFHFQLTRGPPFNDKQTNKPRLLDRWTDRP